MPEIKKQSWNELQSLIQKSQSILLSTHIGADGDGLGSEIAFYYYLKSLSKTCRIINPTPLAYNLTAIDPEGVVEEYSHSMNNCLSDVDLTIVFDIGDHRRVGNIGKQIYGNCISVSIDHHPVRDDHPFKLIIVDSGAPATGYLIWKYFQHIGFIKKKLSINIANALYASVVTDTGSFKYQSTTSDTHYMAAHLIESGVDGYDIQRSIYEQRNVSQVKLLGLVINSLHYSNNGKIVGTIITQKMINSVNGKNDDVDGFTEFIRSIKGVEISFMILEEPNGDCRISFRSSGNYIINDIANIFNGGGHKFAAGAIIKDLSIKQIERTIFKNLSSV